MERFEKLQAMRQFGGPARTVGLADPVIRQFIASHSGLGRAIDGAYAQFEALQTENEDFLRLSELDQIHYIQSGYINFYPDDAVNPYVTAAARGPWVITLKGAVLHDNGGYGMLGLGHAPEAVLEAMSQPHVMANIMTPNYSQRRLIDALRREIGHRRDGDCPFERFLCLNSGSEAVTLAARLADLNAKTQTDPGGRYAGCKIRKLALKGAFHGRTDRPARFSDSSRKTYGKHLASFRDRDNLITVEPNSIEQLEQVFTWAEQNQVFIEAMFMEPVMGEGNPGQAVTPAFYARARELTREHGAVFLVDSIQAGLRSHGVLSIVDYPGFETLDVPDLETYSKALNAGQYPLSVLALDSRTTALYQKGIYGNTMTTNPRALDVACAVLGGLSDAVRQNIRDRGREFLDKFSALSEELDGAITRVQGTGLLFSVELDAGRYKSYGSDSIEEYLRLHGVNVIHGGQNSLRYTPHFNISSEEVDMIVSATREALLRGPVKATANTDTDTATTVAA